MNFCEQKNLQKGWLKNYNYKFSTDSLFFSPIFAACPGATTTKKSINYFFKPRPKTEALPRQAKNSPLLLESLRSLPILCKK